MSKSDNLTKWLIHDINFDSISQSMISLVVLTTLENYP